MLYVGNAFSIQMLNPDQVSTVVYRPISKSEARNVVAGNEFISAVGHPDTAAVISNELGVEIVQNRVSISLDNDTRVLVAQLSVGRLPEGCTKLPDNVTIRYWLVYLSSDERFGDAD